MPNPSEPPEPTPPRERATINPPVFFVSGALLLAFLLFGVFAQSTAEAVFPAVLATVTEKFGWFYVVSVTGFIVYSVWLLTSRYGRLTLGRDGEKPEFSTFSWFAMLFSAGMGIGLVFWGVAEPMYHYTAPPAGGEASAASLRDALPLTFFHWGIHAWAIYVIVGLGIAYFAYRKGLPLALRSCFEPVFGERIYGWLGHLVDIIAVIGTLFGLATSLGLGAMQVSAGLQRVFGIPHATGTQLVLIGVITLLATISLVTGVKKGIRILSETNLVLAASLMAFVFLFGPTQAIVSSMVESTGRYASLLVERSLVVTGVNDAEASWMKSWTLFYWGWWISWAPFVGMFIARISRGRTIREFILGVLLVPMSVTIVWFSVFGGAALFIETQGVGGIAEAVSSDVSTAIFAMLDDLPLSSISSLLAMLVVAIFFITSSDSASFVVDMLTSGGHPNPPKWQRVFWATAEGATAAVLLFAGGKAALDALQSAVISIGLPFAAILCVLVYSLTKSLRAEEVPVAQKARARGRRRAAAPPSPLPPPPTTSSPDVAISALERWRDVERILVPVDLSANAARALRLGVQLGAQLGATVDVLHVVPRPVDYLPLEEWVSGEEQDAPSLMERVEAAGQEAASAFVEETLGANGPALDPVVKVGPPAQTIVATADKERYQLVIVGKRGRSSSRAFRPGGVAERVSRDAPCSVLTVA